MGFLSSSAPSMPYLAPAAATVTPPVPKQPTPQTTWQRRYGKTEGPDTTGAAQTAVDAADNAAGAIESPDVGGTAGVDKGFEGFDSPFS